MGTNKWDKIISSDLALAAAGLSAAAIEPFFIVHANLDLAPLHATTLITALNPPTPLVMNAIDLIVDTWPGITSGGGTLPGRAELRTAIAGGSIQSSDPWFFGLNWDDANRKHVLMIRLGISHDDIHEHIHQSGKILTRKERRELRDGLTKDSDTAELRKGLAAFVKLLNGLTTSPTPYDYRKLAAYFAAL